MFKDNETVTTLELLGWRQGPEPLIPKEKTEGERWIR